MACSQNYKELAKIWLRCYVEVWGGETLKKKDKGWTGK